MEIKSIDLMLNDWVLLNDEVAFGKVVNICSNGYLGVDAFSAKGPCYVYNTEKAFSPVVLTEDILLKNGFKEHDRNLLDLAITQNSSIEYDREIKYFFYKNVDTASVWAHSIEYVHQFQQFLRLCGLSELANNLKIF